MRATLKKKWDESWRFWKVVSQRYYKIRRTTAQWTLARKTIVRLTTWTTYTISSLVIVRYTKLPIIVWNNIGYDKDTSLEKEYFALTSMRELTILLLVSLARLKISQPLPTNYLRRLISFTSKCLVNSTFKAKISSTSSPIIIILST